MTYIERTPNSYVGLRPGEADIVRSAEVISIVRRVSKKVGGKWSWWAKANGVWIVERTA